MPPEADVVDDVKTDDVKTDDTPVNWLDAHEGLSDEDRETLSKYETHEEALKGSAHAIRQVGKAIHLPDENTSEEDRTAFDAKIAAYQGVPKDAKGYELDRTGFPEGQEYDEELETQFREWMSGVKAPKGMAAKIYAAWNEFMGKRHAALQTQAKEAEAAYRKEVGDEEFDAQIGKPGDKENIGTVKQTLLALSAMLKMDYKDKKGDPQSHLIDCLELNRKNGALGDKIPILKVVNWMHQNFFAEGKTFSGDLMQRGEATSEDFFGYKDMDNEDEGGGYGD